MKNSISKIRALYEKQMQSNKDYLAQVKELVNSPNYSQEFKSKQSEKYRANYRDTADKTYTEIMAILTDMKAHEKRHLDLNDASLINALGLIKNLGKEMPRNIIDDINATFKGNQSALSILQKAFKDNDIYNSEIDELCYDVSERYDVMAQAIRKDLAKENMAGYTILYSLDNWTKEVDTEVSEEVEPINDTLTVNFI